MSSEPRQYPMYQPVYERPNLWKDKPKVVIANLFAIIGIIWLIIVAGIVRNDNLVLVACGVLFTYFAVFMAQIIVLDMG